MAEHGLFISYRDVRAGYELEAASLFDKLKAFVTKEVVAEAVAGFDTAILLPNGSGIGGFLLIKGEGTALFELRHKDECLEILTLLAKACNELSVVEALLGDSAARQVERYRNHVTEKSARS